MQKIGFLSENNPIINHLIFYYHDASMVYISISVVVLDIGKTSQERRK